MEENENDEIIISSHGVDGNTVYQAENFKTKKVMISWLGLENFAEKFIGNYPTFSEKIRNYCEDIYPAVLPDKIEFPKEQTHKGRLIEQISLKFSKNK